MTESLFLKVDTLIFRENMMNPKKVKVKLKLKLKHFAAK